MTIEDFFRKGEISILTHNVCIANQIKTFKDLKLHYHKGETFRNLLYCGEKSNDELIAVYNKYKDKYLENKTTQPTSIGKGGVRLEDVVTDLDELTKSKLVLDAYLAGIEQRLNNYLTKKTTPKRVSSEEREKELPQNKDVVSSEKTIPIVNDIVDYEEVEQAVNNYRREQSGKGSSGITNLERKQRSKRRWRVEVGERVKENDAKRKSTFGRHPSKQLNELYSIKSYQGANPVNAKVIFVGRDPNWVADIEEREVFGAVVEYLTDGITFWETHNVHHPFLLKSYSGDGRKYHRSFAKMNLDSSVASKISFVELIGFPTTGMATSYRALFKEFLFSEANRDNLILLDKVLNDPSKIIFIAWGLTDNFKDIYNKTGLLKRFAEIDKRGMSRTQLNRVGNIYIHTHFSDAISTDTIDEIKKEVRKKLIE